MTDHPTPPELPEGAPPPIPPPPEPVPPPPSPELEPPVPTVPGDPNPQPSPPPVEAAPPPSGTSGCARSAFIGGMMIATAVAAVLKLRS